MSLDTTFSMVYYTDLAKTEFGGRASPKVRYDYGLLSLLKMDANFVVYTWKKDIDYLYKFLKSEKIDQNKINNVQIKEFDLYHSPLYETIKSIRGTAPSDSQRSVDVQYSKFLTLNQTISESTTNVKYVYYIDIGLSSCALFPNKYISEKSGLKQYSECVLFNNKFISNINSLTSNGKILAFKQDTSPEANAESRIIRSKYLMIGGMFGGLKDKTLLFSNMVLEFFKEYVKQTKQLPPEESVMTKIHKDYTDLFYDLNFQVWNHEDSGEVFKQMILNKKMFYNIFEELNS